MAEQIKYMSEDERLYLNETRPIFDSLLSKLEQLGAKGKSYVGKDSGAFEFRGIYEIPRQGAVLFHFKEIAKRPFETQPDFFNYNVCVNLLGFKEDTINYQKIKSSIEGVLRVEEFDKI